MNIQDPSTGDSAGVTNNRLDVNSAASPYIAHVSKHEKLAYSWCAVSADIDAGDTALLVCNNDSTKKLHITKIYCYADVATQFKIHKPVFAAFTGTAVTGVNLNLSSTTAAEASAYADETASTFAAANTIVTVRNNESGTDQFGVWVDLEGAVVLGYHDTIAVDIIAESAAFECTIFGYYE